MACLIKFGKMSKFEERVVLQAVKDCLKIATKHNGHVYGGFVRDVIVPKMVDPKCKVGFKDLDIWFDDQVNANNFVTEMGDSFKEDNVIDGTAYPGGFKRTQYWLIKDSVIMAFVDVVVSTELPVDDFDVNTLLFRVRNDEYVCNGSFYDKQLIEQIKQKKAVMMESYMKKIENLRSEKLKIIADKFEARIDNLKNKGWTIISNVSKEPKPMSKTLEQLYKDTLQICKDRLKRTNVTHLNGTSFSKSLQFIDRSNLTENDLHFCAGIMMREKMSEGITEAHLTAYGRKISDLEKLF